VEVAPYIVLCGMLYGMHCGMHSRAIATPGVITYVIRSDFSITPDVITYVIKGIPTKYFNQL